MQSKAERTPIYIIFSFLFPAVLYILVFMLQRVYPFGDNHALVIDLYQQYYPFLHALKDKLADGGSLLWTWNGGLGTNFITLLAYYIASPLNLLITLAPEAYLREVLTLSIAIRIGLAGASCAVMLRGLFKKNDMSLVPFAAMYAVCGFIIGYFWNTIWLDTFALIPLVCLGTVRLLEDRGILLYAVSLSLAVWCNFLMGFYVCVFVLIAFVCVVIIDWQSARVFWRRLLRIAVASLLAIGMTAVLTLPMLMSWSHLYRPASEFPRTLTWYNSFLDVIGNFAAMATPTVRTGLPNVYTGVLSVMLLGAFVTMKRIPRRVRIVGAAVVVLIVVSSNLNVLDYLWNGFNYTNQLPARFTSLLSLTLVIIAFMAFHAMEPPQAHDYIGMLLVGGLVAVCAALGSETSTSALVTFGLICVYLVLMLCYEKGILSKDLLHMLLIVVVIAELGVSAPLGYREIGISERNNYMQNADEVQTLLTRTRASDPDGFYRTEVSYTTTENDPALLNYHGFSMFSSTSNANVMRFLQGIGGGAVPYRNRYVYHETSPVINAVTAMKYYVARDGIMVDETYWQPVDREGGVVLYENESALPLGYMMESEVLTFQGGHSSPFIAQSELLSMASGVQGELFGDPVEVTKVSHKNVQTNDVAPGTYAYKVTFPELASGFKWYFTIPEDGLYYGYMDVRTTMGGEIGLPDSETIEVQTSLPYTMPLGEFSAGDTISLSADMVQPDEYGEVRVYVCRMNPDVFDAAYVRLADEPLIIETFSDTEITGTVTAQRDGLLYTSIPYESGWRAFVDGEAAQVETLEHAMLCLPLEAGEHTIRFTYRPAGLLPGAIISGVSLLALVGFAVWERRRRLARTA